MPRGKRSEGAYVGDQRCAARQLRELLQLENNLPIFEEIRNNIRLVARDFLDVNETPHRQKKALRDVLKELVERFPDLFDAEDKERRLGLVEQMIREQHNNTRQWERTKKRNMPLNNDNARRSSKQLSARPNVSSIKAERPPADDHRRPVYQNVPTNSVEPASSSQPAGSSQNSEDQRPPATPASHSHTYGISTAVQTPARIPVPSTQSSSLSTATTTVGPKILNTPRSDVGRGVPGHEQQASNDHAHQPRINSCSVAPVAPSPRVFKGEELEPDLKAVYRFLQTCTPSMVRLFEGFVDYGCNSEEFILGISHWPPSLIANFIRKVAHKSGEYISDMEADVLQARFMTCYSTR